MTEPALLAVDIGNTNVTLGIFVYAGGRAELAHHWRLATHREQTSDEVLVSLKGLCDLAEFPIARLGDAIVSSVVPPLLPIWERVCEQAARTAAAGGRDRASRPACRCATRTRARSAPTAS